MCFTCLALAGRVPLGTIQFDVDQKDGPCVWLGNVGLCDTPKMSIVAHRWYKLKNKFLTDDCGKMCAECSDKHGKFSGLERGSHLGIVARWFFPDDFSVSWHFASNSQHFSIRFPLHVGAPLPCSAGDQNTWGKCFVGWCWWLWTTKL